MKLILKQDNHATAPYKVIGIKGATNLKWDVGERLSREEVLNIIDSYSTLNRANRVEVEIK
jgi:hypothetical protein